ncbi:hypothetical protein ACC764_19665 [Rhizobium ruizarguesonis]
MNMIDRYREWLQNEIKCLSDQIRIIEDGTARYHSIIHGEKTDITEQILADNKDKLQRIKELLATPETAFRNHVGEMKSH